MKQGQYLTQDETDRIITFLRDSDLTPQQITVRLQCSRSVIAAINRRFVVRVYRDGKKSEWTVNGVIKYASK